MSTKIRLSKQINPSNARDTAVAPYNFVPLNDELVSVDPKWLPPHNVYDEGKLHSGTISCALTTVSPVYIRAPLDPEQFKDLESNEDKRRLYTERLRNRPDFFYTDPLRTPRIPGSSLRGMVRTMVEIIGHGKFESGAKEPLVFRSIGDITDHGDRYRRQILQEDERGRDERGKLYYAYTPRVRAGYLVQEQGNWRIYPAQSIQGTSFARLSLRRLNEIRQSATHMVNEESVQGLEPVAGCKNAHYIYIQSGPWVHQRVRGGLIRMRYAKVLRASGEPGAGLVKGVVACSGDMFSKRSEAVVFPLDEMAEPLPVSDDLILTYRGQISQEQQHLLGDEGVLTAPDSGDASLGEDGRPLHRQPVFYLLDTDGNLVFFGHTMMMRLPYPHSPRDYVPERLRQEETVDLAESIFGYTKSQGKSVERAYAGRVFFEDAILEPDQKDIWLSEKPLTPRILATPKPTAFQQYLVQTHPDAVKVGETRDGRAKWQKFLADYTMPGPDNASGGETTLRGYKLYWQSNGRVSMKDIAEPKERLDETWIDKRGSEPVERTKRDSQYTQMRPVKGDVAFRFQVRFENLASHELGALLWALELPDAPAGQEYLHKIGMGKPHGLGSIRLEPTLFLENRQARYGQLFNQNEKGDSDWFAPARNGDKAHFVERFEAFMQEQLDASTTNFTDRTRIQALLKLMSYPGPAGEQRRYLEIERPDSSSRRGKHNEYRDRPVLPSPLSTPPAVPGKPERAEPDLPDIATPEGGDSPRHVMAAQMYQVTEPEPPRPVNEALVGDILTAIKSSGDSGIKQDVQPAVTPEKKAPAVERPASAADIKPNMVLMGTVVSVEHNRVVVQLETPDADEASLMLDQIVPDVNQAELAERFPAGSMLQAKVRRINKRGRVQLTLRGL